MLSAGCAAGRAQGLLSSGTTQLRQAGGVPHRLAELGSLMVKVANPACLPRTGWTADALTANRADRQSSPSRNAYEVAKAETG